MANLASRLEFVPMDELTKPRDGRTVVDHWWVVCPERGAAFWRVHRNLRTPQCNANEAIARGLQAKLYPELTVQHIPVAFLGDKGGDE